MQILLDSALTKTSFLCGRGWGREKLTSDIIKPHPEPSPLEREKKDFSFRH
jgi:hypothetical protein